MPALAAAREDAAARNIRSLLIETNTTASPPFFVPPAGPGHPPCPRGDPTIAGTAARDLERGGARRTRSSPRARRPQRFHANGGPRRPSGSDPPVPASAADHRSRISALEGQQANIELQLAEMREGLLAELKVELAAETSELRDRIEVLEQNESGPRDTHLASEQIDAGHPPWPADAEGGGGGRRRQGW